jgi:hypothetical protein
MADIEKGYVPQELVNKGYKDLVVSLENKKYIILLFQEIKITLSLFLKRNSKLLLVQEYL